MHLLAIIGIFAQLNALNRYEDYVNIKDAVTLLCNRGSADRKQLRIVVKVLETNSNFNIEDFRPEFTALKELTRESRWEWVLPLPPTGDVEKAEMGRLMCNLESKMQEIDRLEDLKWKLEDKRTC
jgi:hypothetical protein